MEAAVNAMLYLAVMFIEVIAKVVVVAATAIFHLAVVGFELISAAISERKAQPLEDQER
jgi:hypothetical protein